MIINLSNNSEEAFIRDLLAYDKNILGYAHASKEEDMYQHWDYKVYYKGTSIKIDVKEMKKWDRQDENTDEDLLWIELMNVHGNTGWLYGDADFIAFEQYWEWLIVSRIQLADLISHLVVDTTIYTTKQKYKRYRRKGRKDIVTAILVEDIEQIIKVRIPKE